VPGVIVVEMVFLREAAHAEAQCHRWIESQKHGRDLGDDAVSDWYERYWSLFCRLKCLEHLGGTRYWPDFAEKDFGLIRQLFAKEDLLLELLLDCAQCGMENLNIIWWAKDWCLPIDRVLDILEALHLNRAQLDPGPPRFAKKIPL